MKTWKVNRYISAGWNEEIEVKARDAAEAKRRAADLDIDRSLADFTIEIDGCELMSDDGIIEVETPVDQQLRALGAPMLPGMVDA